MSECSRHECPHGRNLIERCESCISAAFTEGWEACREAAIKATCPYCRGEHKGFSRTPQKPRDYEGLMHLAQGYPPRECKAAALHASLAPPADTGAGE